MADTLARFVVTGPDGALLRFGSCHPDEVAHQARRGESVARVDAFPPGIENDPAAEPGPDGVMAEARAARRHAFQIEADPLFFKAQRGEAAIADYHAKVAEIRARFPYPDEDPHG